MGYSENGCQICAVSINTARLRTKSEPESAGWGYTGGKYYSGGVSDYRYAILLKMSGCEVVESDGSVGDDFLHFPGRGCTFDGGYSSMRIGPDEMKVNCFGCLVLILC